ncbi:MAG TPA: hypothetical protein PLH02_05970 [Bacillota bacterium]|nr:hypothetical protein [Bacillota bacterium]HPF42886.1 hypothetical protein [Bacillota bacterium]HPJ86356.1 hypothetical protein [Bacillota bacterium]HPQ62390.1 hypothetical protein [Bacillota bacterium]HRX92081.1 hypothetical protein [Candidatus Izemoplasmatales bacterium]
MEDSEVKKYFKKINTTFAGVNKQDDFARMFLNLIKSGNTTLYQKERRERRIFDDSWMDSVEGAIPVIDKLTRNPREILKKVNLVVPVERAKHIDQDTVKHLAQNTHLIKDVDEEGNVIPSKVLTYFNESDLGTYENRFLRSFVDKLYTFIEKRYDLVVQKMHTEYVNYLNIKSEVEWEESTIEFDITMRLNEIIKKDEIDMKNQELFDRMTKIRRNITIFKMSDFMQEMKKFSPVTPPIMKTNLIMKNQDFRQCYYLWVLMDQVDRIGYDIDIFERDVEFDEGYMSGIENMLMVLYSTVANNQNDEFVIAQNEPYEYRKIKRPRIKKTDQNDQYVQPGYYEFEDNSLNQYYLDQVRSANQSRFKSLEDAGIPMTESIDIVFQQMSQITNAIYEDFIRHSFRPEEEKDLEQRIRLQEQILEVYRQVEKIKRDDMRQLSTTKAIALLNLRNYQDELKARKKFEQEEKERAEEEEKMSDDIETKAKAESEADKKRQLERARKILEDARKEREKKQTDES